MIKTGFNQARQKIKMPKEIKGYDINIYAVSNRLQS